MKRKTMYVTKHKLLSSKHFGSRENYFGTNVIDEITEYITHAIEKLNAKKTKAKDCFCFTILKTNLTVMIMSYYCQNRNGMDSVDPYSILYKTNLTIEISMTFIKVRILVSSLSETTIRVQQRSQFESDRNGTTKPAVLNLNLVTVPIVTQFHSILPCNYLCNYLQCCIQFHSHIQFYLISKRHSTIHRPLSCDSCSDFLLKILTRIDLTSVKQEGLHFSPDNRHSFL